MEKPWDDLWITWIKAMADAADMRLPIVVRTDAAVVRKNASHPSSIVSQ